MGDKDYLSRAQEQVLAARTSNPAKLAEFDHQNMATLQEAIAVPAGLRAALDTNPKLAATFHLVVSEVVRMTFIHPDTKPAVITGSVIRERAHACLYALDTMYNEQGLGLRQCYDMLPDVVINALRMGKRADDVAAEATPGKWTRTVQSVQAPGEFGEGVFEPGQDLSKPPSSTKPE
jgi:hypothetical protein